MTDYLLIALLAVGASFVERTTGFGFGIFIMTVLPFLMPSYGEATTLSGLLALTTTLIICSRMRKLIIWKHLWPILITFIVVSGGAVYMLSRMQLRSLTMSLGIILILISIYFLTLGGKIRIKPTVKAQIITGSLSGLMGGFFGMQGPPAVLYFISSEKDKDHYMAIISMYFCLGNLAMTFFRAGSGFLTLSVCKAYVAGIAGVFLGTYIGTKVFERIPAQVFRYVVYAYIGICGIIILSTLK